MATVTLNIPAATFISSAQPTNNFSDYSSLYAGTDPGFGNCTGLMQVDLSQLPAASVDSALLQLAVLAKSGGAPSPVVVNRVTAPFDISTVTYDTQPAYTATPSQIGITTADIFTTVQIDVTDLVNDWLSNTFPNNGIALTNSDGTTAVQFATENIIFEPYFPRLILTYTPVEPVSGVCFAYSQLAHIIEQLIVMYPTDVFTVFTTSLSPSSVTGTPYQLYKSPEGTEGAIFILWDNGEEAIPLNSITAIYTGAGTVYNPSISYLPTPVFAPDCGTNLITAYHDYLPVSTDVQMYAGAIISASGMIYRNEYGLLVLSDVAGNTPIFVPVLNISMVLPVVQQEGLQGVPHLPVTITSINKT